MKYLTHEQEAPDRQGSEDGRATPLDAEEADIGWVDERESGLEEVQMPAKGVSERGQHSNSA